LKNVAVESDSDDESQSAGSSDSFSEDGHANAINDSLVEDLNSGLQVDLSPANSPVELRRSSKKVMRQKQYEDILEHSTPFWFVRFTTQHYRKVLCVALTFYTLMTYFCVTLGLVSLAEVRD
jgi:hypothetical protein